jgi:ATP-dependent Clp protease, protease subunit
MKLKKNIKAYTSGNIRMDDLDDDIEDVLHEPYLSFLVETEVSQIVRIPLDEYIQEPKYYRNILAKMESLGPNDAVIITISSYGGLLDGALTIIDAIQRTEATVIGVITGMAASAASIIALHCDELYVTEYARMLAHTARLGNSGKLPDVHDAHNFNRKFITRVFEDAYEGFLTPQEIEICLAGKEMYFDAEEIELRLLARKAFRELPEEDSEENPN